jgi:hypothetical protein
LVGGWVGGSENMFYGTALRTPKKDLYVFFLFKNSGTLVKTIVVFVEAFKLRENCYLFMFKFLVLDFLFWKL